MLNNLGITVPRTYRGFGRGVSYENNSMMCKPKYKKPFLGYEATYNYGENLIKS